MLSPISQISKPPSKRVWFGFNFMEIFWILSLGPNNEAPIRDNSGGVN